MTPQAAPTNYAVSPLDRALQVFAPVRSGEGVVALLMVFCVLLVVAAVVLAVCLAAFNVLAVINLILIGAWIAVAVGIAKKHAAQTTDEDAFDAADTLQWRAAHTLSLSGAQ
jgi:hypothetical protein